MGIQNQHFQFSGGLANICKLADLKMARLLEKFDQWLPTQDKYRVTETAQRFAPTRIAKSPLLTLSTQSIKTVIWATGYRPDYRWLNVPVVDSKGSLVHTGGVVNSPGMYVMGLPFLRSRKSSFIHGASDDAAALSEHLQGYLRNSNSNTARYKNTARRQVV
jgi:putative flavoprotein involved in K+ transport